MLASVTTPYEMFAKSFILFYLMYPCFISGVDCFDWIQVPSGGPLKHVSTSINYHWGVDNGDEIYRCTLPCTEAWVKVPGRLMQTDVSDMEVWGVNSAHNIYKRAADGSGSWIKVSGKLKHVSASGNGYIWGA